MSGRAIEVRVALGSRAATAAQALVSSLEEAFPVGRAIFSHMEQEEAVGLLMVLNQEAFDPIDDIRDVGWWTGTARRR